MISTSLTNKPADLIACISNTKTFESGFLTFCHRSFCQYCSTDRSGYIKMRRNYNILSNNLFEGSNYCFIVCYTALKENFIAYPSVTDYFLEIIIDDGISESPDKIFISGSLLHK